MRVRLVCGGGERGEGLCFLPGQRAAGVAVLHDGAEPGRPAAAVERAAL